MIDQLRRLALQEQIGTRRSWRHRIHGNIATADLVGENMGHRLDAALGGGVDAVGWLVEVEANDARRKIDDPAAGTKPRGGLAHTVEDAFNVDGDSPVEQRIVAFADRRKLHDTGVTHQDIDAAESLLRTFEEQA